MDDPQFEKDARRMKRGMLSSPLEYRKMYAENNKTSVPARTLRDKQIEDAENAAIGVGHNPGPSMTDEARQRINSGN